MVTEIAHQSWLFRLGKSIAGVLFGFLFFLGALILMVWNEGRAIKTATGLKEGAANVVLLQEPKLDPSNNDHLVHFTGEASSDSILKDPFFELSTKAIKFKRTVEMYQWKENSREQTKTSIGGGTDTTTTYSYEKVWSEKLISSKDFHEEGHKNPSTMPLRPLTLTAEPVTVGDFTLNTELVEQMDKFEALPVPKVLPKDYTAEGDTVYKSVDPDQPEIGNLRVTFSEVRAAKVSIIAGQQDEDLQAYTTKTGTTINMLVYGSESAQQMFSNARFANTMITWILRLAGFFILFLGGVFVLAPVGVLADVLPFMGSIARFGTGLLAFLVAIPIGFITIALAWIAYRPLLGITLLILAVGIPVGFLIMRKNRSVKVTV